MKIAGIVLAGGLSSRMGQDKAKLKLDAQSLLNRAVLLLEDINLDQVFVSGNYPNYNSIVDIHLEFGPIGGLHACVDKLIENYDAIFILPVDMPLISKPQCDLLLAEFKQHPEGVFFGSVTFPMLLPLNLSLKKYLEEVLVSTEKKQRSLYRLLKSLKIHSVNYNSQQQFRFQNSN
ncbi:MAG: molybdenum cofactor guanylyltransferase, partial [Psychromonas sp.]